MFSKRDYTFLLLRLAVVFMTMALKNPAWTVLSLDNQHGTNRPTEPLCLHTEETLQDEH